MTTLARDLQGLDWDLLQSLSEHAFDRDQLLSWSRLLEEAARAPSSAAASANRVSGEVRAPAGGDVTDLPKAGSPEAERLAAAGRAALAKGELAVVVLAGGMATRMGGVVKALVRAVGTETFLDLRLAEREHWSRLAGTAVPLWLMTSYATDEAIKDALRSRNAGNAVTTFVQQASLRLTSDGNLFRSDDDEPSVYATGHGDLPDALLRKGLLAQFLARGGRHLLIANLDNIGATVDPVLLGWHMQHDKPLSVEVVDKVGSDRGGIPVRYQGRPVILEELRLPTGFDAARVRVFNTNTFWVDARALSELAMAWTYLQVEKKVGTKSAIQFERLIGELTFGLATAFVRVSREGDESRFLPVKDTDELRERNAQIASIARARGMLSVESP